MTELPNWNRPLTFCDTCGKYIESFLDHYAGQRCKPATTSTTRLPVDHAVKGSLASQTHVSEVGVDGVKAARRVVENARHGTTSGYLHDGCRCDLCSDAKRKCDKRTRVDVSRGGPMLVDAGPLRAVVRYAEASGFTSAEISQRAGIDKNYLKKAAGYQLRVHRERQDVILEAVERMAAERAAALDDLRSAIQRTRGVEPGKRHKDGSSWPVAPLRETIDRHWPKADRWMGGDHVPPLSESDRSYLYHAKRLDSARADRLCSELGLYPEDVWGPGWFGYDVREAG